MKRFSFVHCADLHLDSPLRGLPAYEGAPIKKIRLCSRSALEQLVDNTLRERHDFVVIAGDVFDGNWPDFSTGHFFSQQMNKLAQAEIPVYLSYGNHDAASRMTRSLIFPSNVHIFSSDRPTTFLMDHLGVALHGQSYANEAQSNNVASQYPPALPDLWNIGVLHTSLDGRPGHASYAPCSESQLRDFGYQYWALGHVHSAEILETPYCKIVYPGCLQGRHIREFGPKGYCSVTVEDNNSCKIQQVVIPLIEWQELVVYIDDCLTIVELLDQINSKLQKLSTSQAQTYAIRLRLEGFSPLATLIRRESEALLEEVRNLFNQQEFQVWLEKIVTRLRPPTHVPSIQPEFIETLKLEAEQIKSNFLENGECTEDLQALFNRLPRTLRAREEFPDLKDPNFQQEIIEEALEAIIAELQGGF